jgi:hypothetical protein
MGMSMYVGRKPELALALQEGDAIKFFRLIMRMYLRRIGKVIVANTITKHLQTHLDTPFESIFSAVLLSIFLLDSMLTMTAMVMSKDEYWMAAHLLVHKLFVVLWRLEGLPFSLCFALFPELFQSMWTMMLFVDIFWTASFENSVGKLVK